MINSKESGIASLRVLVCGKTSYIKLIADNPGKKFVFLDASTFQYIGDASFIELLTNKREFTVFVVEDCEDLLVSRDTKGNHRISSLLNLSDGILGDSSKP